MDPMDILTPESGTTPPAGPKKQDWVLILLIVLLVILALIVKPLVIDNISTYVGVGGPKHAPSPLMFDTTKTYPSTNLPQTSGPSIYAGDFHGDRFYSETQIDSTNARKLHLGWTTSVDGGSGAPQYGFTELGPSFECSPIIVDNRMIVVTASEALVALNLETGKMLWRFMPKGYNFSARIARGAACWIGNPGSAHRYRVLYSFESNVYEVDAITGSPVRSFGNDGHINAAAGLSRGHPELMRNNSPPLVVGNFFLVPFMINDDIRADAPWGDVRAYDIQTGNVRWTFHTLLDRTRTVGAANAWSMYSYDPERQLIYLPVGSASNDHYGVTRPGDDKYSDCLVCLHAQTGVLDWYFQCVHHDLWDYDCPAEPMLFDFKKDGAEIPAVALPTKMGRLFLFNRVTGVPLFPVKEVPVPRSTIPGENTSPTQPVETLPPPLIAQGVKVYPAFTPPSISGIVQAPGNFGGCNWAGCSFDYKDNLIVTTVNNAPFGVKLTAKSPDRIQSEPDAGAPYAVNYTIPPGKPPFGLMCAIDPVDRKIAWERPYGYEPNRSSVKNYMSLGSNVIGGEICTASGLTIAAGTDDAHLRFIESKTGVVIASYPLPFVGGALPIAYSIDGKEYVTVCSGGHYFLGGPTGDKVITFSL